MMSKAWFIALLCACVLSGERLCAFSSDEAHRIYDERFKSAPASIQSYKDYLFVICEGPLDAARRGDASADILAAQLEALERYIGDGTFGYLSPFPSRLTDRLGKKIEFSIPSCRVVTVEEHVGEKSFREASAFELAPINVERDRVRLRKPSRRTVEAWIGALSNLWMKCATDVMRERMMMEMGCVVPLLHGGGKGCVGNAFRIDGRKVEELLVREDRLEKANEEACRSALLVLPSYSFAHRRLACLALERDDAVSCLDECLRASYAGSFDKDVWDRAIELAVTQSGSDAWRDYARLRKMVEAGQPPERWCESSPRMAVWRTLGKVLEQDSQDENSYDLFVRAHNLYRRGQELPKIINLLERAIDINPGNGDYWRCYGDALRTDKRMLPAALAYQEALTLGNDCLPMLVDLALVYRSLEFTELADSVCWWVALQTKDKHLQNRCLKLLKEWNSNVIL